MNMYRLISALGNEVIETENERRRDRLINLGYTEVAATVKTVDEMTVPELEAYAKEKNIDLSGCSNKTEKLAAIKAAEE